MLFDRNKVPQPDYVDLFVKGHGVKFKATKQGAIDEANESWCNIANDVNVARDSVVLVCGAKNNGKSSLLRYMVNNSLKTLDTSMSRKRKRSDDNIEDGDNNNKFDCVYYMDCDPGQPELTSPGLVSAHAIRHELRIPQYLNVWQHEQIVVSSVAGINMNIDPVVYVNNCAFVFEKLQAYRCNKSTPLAPIFINTMGWVKNVGLAMLTDLIKVLCPTHVIVLNAPQDPQRVLYAEFDAQTLRYAPFSFYAPALKTNNNDHNQVTHDDDSIHNINLAGTRSALSRRRVKHRLFVYNLSFAFKDSQSTARLNRSASQLAYLSCLPDSMYMPLLKTAPKRVALDKVSVYCCASYPLKPRIVLELLPNSWVHLCRIECVSPPASPSPCLINETSSNNNVNNASGEKYEASIVKVMTSLGLNRVIGCGLILRVDASVRCVYIVTPLDEGTLDEQVDCLVKPQGIPFAPEAGLSYQDSDAYDQTIDFRDTILT